MQQAVRPETLSTASTALETTQILRPVATFIKTHGHFITVSTMYRIPSPAKESELGLHEHYLILA